MQNSTILVVDDDRRLRDLLVKFLKEKDFRVSSANSAAEARAQLALNKVDLIVLDIMMPGENGLELTQSLRESGNDVPILFLTAKDSVDEKIEGLDIGADDYLTKPFEPSELTARIRAILRRNMQGGETRKEDEILRFGRLTFSLKEGALQDETSKIQLSSTELILLKTLAQSPWQPFSRADLAQRIGHRVEERTVDVQITRLRRKLQDDSRHPKFIQTVRHIGYTLCPD
ncbi:response regulator [Candidatus Paracaedibacter symbiosus]|uniref:response regulator n=1 Tax=Candidatus Paracaedibacter symbiosus TaxID=244582 RepID=UPI000509A61F|nr:response regulator transcription factor [Candidatus Paracaedibacter symbiosus]